MRAATWLYVFGALALGAAYLSGRAGADDVIIPAQAESILADHEDWALRTLVLFCVLAVIRVGILRIPRLRNRILNGFLAIVGLVGVGFLTVTGDLGASLVFGHGVGVSTSKSPVVVTEIAAGDTSFIQPEGFLWIPGPNAASQLRAFQDFGTGISETVVDLGLDSVLVIQAGSEPSIAVTRVPFGPVQIECEVNLDRFAGRFDLVYGALSKDSYDYTVFEGRRIAIGRSNPTGSSVIDVDEAELSGWTKIGGASDGDHFRGYLDGKLVAHGHQEPSPQGGVGFRIDGDGIILIRSLRVTPLR